MSPVENSCLNSKIATSRGRHQHSGYQILTTSKEGGILSPRPPASAKSRSPTVASVDCRNFGGGLVTPSPRRLKTPINVLVVAPDNMTAELLTNAFSRGRSNFAVTTLIGTSNTVSDKLPR